jgi:hypothetical protein
MAGEESFKIASIRTQGISEQEGSLLIPNWRRTLAILGGAFATSSFRSSCRLRLGIRVSYTTASNRIILASDYSMEGSDVYPAARAGMKSGEGFSMNGVAIASLPRPPGIPIGKAGKTIEIVVGGDGIGIP